jgi:hypothetical protein
MICLSPNEVERRFAILRIPNRFTSREKHTLSTTSLGEHEGAIFVFPTPIASADLNILTLRGIVGTNPARQPSFFDHPWYLEEPFGRLDCEPGWHALSMDVLPDSISKPINYSSSLKLPSAIEVVFMLFLHYVGTGEQLLLKKHTWTSNEASLGRFVTVGAFGRNGVFISSQPGNYTSRGLGICPKWTFQKI